MLLKHVSDLSFISAFLICMTVVSFSIFRILCNIVIFRTRCILRTLQKILQKFLTAWIFWQKRSVLDIWLGSEHDSVSISSTLHKKWSFPLRIFLVNVIKCAVSCGFGHIYWRNTWWKTSFFVQCNLYNDFRAIFDVLFQAYSEIFREYSREHLRISVTLCKLAIFKN